MATKVAEFVASSSRYAKATVAKANVDGNRNLTKLEAKKLPKDLQDNFANFRAASGNGVVSAAKFAESYGQYVAAMAKMADSNGDGILTTTEAKKLTADLRDNLADFEASLHGGAGGAGKQLQTPAQRQDAIYNRQLPAASSFGKLTKALDQQLADGNISDGGVSGVASGKLTNKKPTDADLKTWATELMTDYFHDTGGTTAEHVTATTMTSAKALKAAGMILAVGNAFDTSNPDNVNSLIDGNNGANGDEKQIGLKEVIAKLGTPVSCVSVNGKDADGGVYPRIGLTAFLNNTTGQFVAFYGHEGSM